MADKYKDVVPAFAEQLKMLMGSVEQLQEGYTVEKWDTAYNTYRSLRKSVVETWKAHDNALFPEWLQYLWDILSAPDYGIFGQLYWVKEQSPHTAKHLEIISRLLAKSYGKMPIEIKE